MLGRLIDALREALRGLRESLEEQAVEAILAEARQLEALSLLLLALPLLGVPGAPLGPALEVLSAASEEELRTLVEATVASLDALADAFSVLGGEW